MLFHSGIFLTVFLPVVLGAYLLLRQRVEVRPYVLIAGSLVFYTYWDWRFTPILFGSLLFNFAVSVALNRLRDRDLARRLVLGSGVAGNLALLAWFKYMDWFLAEVLRSDPSDGTGGFTAIAAIGLPLGISFYTFQQISYLVDRYRDPERLPDLASYAAYVSFFPQLVAGPIVLHRTFAPQLRETLSADAYLHRFLLGLLVFSVGFLKKIYLADNLAVYANQVFALAQHQPLELWEAWLGTFSYGLQLYFDFSGYSDMAIGLGLLFGFKLPANFDSPYKATSIIDFWRRWHITLSSFLREYLYVPLGGSRRGDTRTTVNLMTVMVLGGLWHGAGWTFIFWGAYHGLLLVANHWWRKLLPELRPNRYLARVSTLVLVMVGWVFFRAADLPTALAILAAMGDFSWDSLVRSGELAFAAGNKMKLSIFSPFWTDAAIQQRALAFTLLGLAIVTFLPNLNALHQAAKLPERLTARLKPRLVIVTLAVLLPGGLSVFQMWRNLNEHSIAPAEFIYFIF